MWQDAILSVIFFLLWVPIIPMLRAPEKPPLLSSVPNGILLIASALIFATLHLWLSVFSQAVAGILWLALAYQKWRQSHR